MPLSALRRGDVVRIRDERWTVSETLPYDGCVVLTVVGCDRSNRDIRARYLLPFESFERLPSSDNVRAVSHRRWQHLAREVIAHATPAAHSLIAAATADIAILPYQLEPALAVVSGIAARVLIADEVGLGKTVQAGLIVGETLARRGDAHVLVICPAGLREQWHDELTRRFDLSPATLDSTALRRLPFATGTNPWRAHPLVVTSTDFIKRPEVIRALESIVWDLVVIDEAHGVAGHSDRHDAAHLLAQRARVAVLLTATPHPGSDDAFDRLRSVGDLDNAFPLMVFRRTRAATSASAGRRTRWLRIRPTAIERQMHRALVAYVSRVWRRPASPGARLAMIILTRRACSSASSLARTLERRLALLHADVSTGAQLALPLDSATATDEEPAEIGAPGFEDSERERRAIEAVLTLARQAASAESKFRSLQRLLRRAQEPAIVFTEYRDTLRALDGQLAPLGTCQLHGGLTAFERSAAIHTFVAGKKRVLLATDAASEGLNLHQRCRLVIHLEVPWTPTRIEQRVGRVDRIGQTRTVHQVHLVAAGTIEESRVVRVVQRMSQIARSLNAFAASPGDHQHAAACVIGNERLPPVPRPAPMPHGTIAGDLRLQAADEAQRLFARRKLRASCAESVATPRRLRPFVTSARTVAGPSAWLAMWLELSDSDDRLLWETLVGVQGTHSWSRPGSLTDLRRLVDAASTQVRSQVGSRRSPVADALTEFVRATAVRARDREEAIAAGIERRRGRMAAPLIQQGLFDRRAERDTLAQRELIDQAAGHCRARIAELNRRSSAARIRVHPAFSLIAW